MRVLSAAGGLQPMALMATLADLDPPFHLPMPSSSTHLPGTLLSLSLLLILLLGTMNYFPSPGVMPLLDW